MLRAILALALCLCAHGHAVLTPFLGSSSGATAEDMAALAAVARAGGPVLRPGMPIIQPGAAPGATLFAQPSAIREYDDVTITWCVNCACARRCSAITLPCASCHRPVVCRSGIQSRPADFVTISCGKTNGINDYMDFVYANATPVTFSRLVNLRCDYVFT